MVEPDGPAIVTGVSDPGTDNAGDAPPVVSLQLAALLHKPPASPIHAYASAFAEALSASDAMGHHDDVRWSLLHRNFFLIN
jgi:hypothetical protein